MKEKNLTLLVALMSNIGMVLCMWTLYILQHDNETVGASLAGFILNAGVFILAITKYNRL